MFDVKKQYTNIKENHPNYQQIHMPAQNSVKVTYLNQMNQKLSHPLQVANNSYLGGRTELI